jgi:hypothetical protein
MGKQNASDKHGEALPVDLTARRIVEALDDDRFDFRTVQGLSEALDFPEDLVQEVLDESDLVRISPVPGPNGEALYALRSQPVTTREKLALARVSVEKSVS